MAAEQPSLAKARMLYNAGDYDGAIAAADVARADPGSADAAALVAARAHLERYRASHGDPADLTAARQALEPVRIDALLTARQVDLLVGLGQALYLGDTFGAAAELFDTALSRASRCRRCRTASGRCCSTGGRTPSIARRSGSAPSDARRSMQPVAARMEEELCAGPR